MSHHLLDKGGLARTTIADEANFDSPLGSLVGACAEGKEAETAQHVYSGRWDGVGETRGDGAALLARSGEPAADVIGKPAPLGLGLARL